MIYHASNLENAPRGCKATTEISYRGTRQDDCGYNEYAHTATAVCGERTLVINRTTGDRPVISQLELQKDIGSMLGSMCLGCPNRRLVEYTDFDGSY